MYLFIFSGYVSKNQIRGIFEKRSFLAEISDLNAELRGIRQSVEVMQKKLDNSEHILEKVGE